MINITISHSIKIHENTGRCGRNVDTYIDKQKNYAWQYFGFLHDVLSFMLLLVMGILMRFFHDKHSSFCQTVTYNAQLWSTAFQQKSIMNIFCTLHSIFSIHQSSYWHLSHDTDIFWTGTISVMTILWNEWFYWKTVINVICGINRVTHAQWLKIELITQGSFCVLALPMRDGVTL